MECEQCDGRGWNPEHSPKCNGDCDTHGCPYQVQCVPCLGTGLVQGRVGKPTPITITYQGAVLVNHAMLMYESDKVVMIEVDLNTRNAILDAFGNQEVYLEADSDSHPVNQNPVEALTCIRFDDWVDSEEWYVHTCQISKYTLFVTLISSDKYYGRD